MRKHQPSDDDILYGFAVDWDETPQSLTEWKSRFPAQAPEMELIALEIIRERIRKKEDRAAANWNRLGADL